MLVSVSVLPESPEIDIYEGSRIDSPVIRGMLVVAGVASALRTPKCDTFTTLSSM